CVLSFYFQSLGEPIRLQLRLSEHAASPCGRLVSLIKLFRILAKESPTYDSPEASRFAAADLLFRYRHGAASAGSCSVTNQIYQRSRPVNRRSVSDFASP